MSNPIFKLQFNNQMLIGLMNKSLAICLYRNAKELFNQNGKYQAGELIVCTNAGRKSNIIL